MRRFQAPRSRLLGHALGVALVALAVPSGRVTAQSSAAGAPAPPPPVEQASVWNDRIVVTASRGERLAGDVPFQVLVLAPLDLPAATDFTASDLVSRQVPSLNLQVASSSLVAAPRDQSLSLRGVGGGSVSRALLLVDGLPMLDPYNSSAIWSKVPLALIDRVEVVPGGGASVWGNLALSGVVNLITRAPSDRALDLTARVAERSTRGLTATYSDVVGKWAGWIAADHLSTDGYQVTEPALVGPADEPEFREYDSLTASASHAFSPGAVVHLRALAYREERGEGTRLDFAENEEWTASASADLVADPRSSWQLRLFGRRSSLDDSTGDVDDEHATVVPSSDIFDLTSESFGASAVWSRVRGERHTLSAGLDFQQLSVERAEDLDHDGARFTHRYEIAGKQQLAGGYVESRWRLDPRWSAQVAARFDAIRTFDGSSRRTDLVTSALREDERLDENTETTVNPSAGFTFQASAASRLRGAVYTGFRAPAPSELFVGSAPRNNRETAPNPDLAPEELIGAEAGYDYSPSRRLTANVTGFWSETDNLIERITLGRVGSGGGVLEPCGAVGPNGACQQRRNLGTTRAYGVEVGAEMRPHPRWRVQLGAAFLVAEVVENPAAPELVGNELEHTPGERVTLGITYEDPRGYSIAVRGRHVGDHYTETENENLLPAHEVFDLSLSHAVSERLELFAGVENLLDEEYRVDHGSDGFAVGAPRTIQVGVRFRAGG